MKVALKAVLDRLQTGECGHHGFAAADIALQQAAHRVRLAEVVADFLPGARLRGCQRKRQRADERGCELLPCGQRPGWEGLALLRAVASDSCCASSSSKASRCQAGWRRDSSSASAQSSGGWCSRRMLASSSGRPSSASQSAGRVSGIGAASARVTSLPQRGLPQPRQWWDTPA